MILQGSSVRKVDTSPVVELSEAQSLELMRRWNIEDYPDIGDGLEELQEYSRREGRLWGEHCFGILDHDGRPIAITKLRSDGSVAWVEDVYTVPEARRTRPRPQTSHICHGAGPNVTSRPDLHRRRRQRLATAPVRRYRLPPRRKDRHLPQRARSAPVCAMKLKLDLHDVYNRGDDIERALHDVIEEAVRKRASVVEIIPGKGSGQLKKRVLRFLAQEEIKSQYHRVEKDSTNFGRVFVHFLWKRDVGRSARRRGKTGQ